MGGRGEAPCLMASLSTLLELFCASHTSFESLGRCFASHEVPGHCTCTPVYQSSSLSICYRSLGMSQYHCMNTKQQEFFQQIRFGLPATGAVRRTFGDPCVTRAWHSKNDSGPSVCFKSGRDAESRLRICHCRSVACLSFRFKIPSQSRAPDVILWASQTSVAHDRAEEKGSAALD
ncbi:hypothetical protein BD309DRAFT_948870, partial [Dichomitus squalens]